MEEGTFRRSAEVTAICGRYLMKRVYNMDHVWPKDREGVNQLDYI